MQIIKWCTGPQFPVVRRKLVRLLAVSSILLLGCSAMVAQQSPPPDAPDVQAPQQKSDAKPKEEGAYGKHHILWIIPNYRADESGAAYAPLTPHEKFKVAVDDSFDPTAFLVAGVFAGSSMAQKQYASFGQGGEGFAKYYGGAFADQAIGNMFTEALLPIALRQDPRYFTMGKSGFFKRTGYAISREVITRNDDGKNHFNTSELLGNAFAAGISNVYYPAADRSFSNTANKWGQQIGLDAAFNIMKEFWPDVRRKTFGK